MKVLLVGGSGFIGSRLIGVLLERGHEVTNVDLRPSAEHPAVTTLGDVRDLAAMTSASAGVDVVINLAAEHRDDVRPLSLYEEVNVGGARTLVQAVQAGGVRRIVFTSSVAVYGLGVPHPSETSPTAPFNEYGRTKLLAEGVYRGWAEADPARGLAIVRSSVVFGEGNRGNVWTLAQQVASGRFLMVGDGHNRKSMAYVGNVAAYLAGVIEDGPPGATTTNYADKPDLPTRELVELLQNMLGSRPRLRRPVPLALGMAAGHGFDLLARVSGRSFPISAVRIRKFGAETTVDTSRLEASGFQRLFSLTDGLRRTLAADLPQHPAVRT